MNYSMAKSLLFLSLLLQSAGGLHSGPVTPVQKELLTKFNDNNLFSPHHFPNTELSDDGFLRSTLSALQNSIIQWAFVENQVLDTDARLSKPELYIPLRQIISTLESLGNLFFERGDYDGATTSLEVACPLMEIIPPLHLRKSAIQITNCFEHLKHAYSSAQFSSDPSEIQDRLKELRRPYQRLKFEFNYKDIANNVSAQPTVLENFFRKYIAEYPGPCTEIAHFLAADVAGIAYEEGSAYDLHLDTLYRVAWEKTLRELPPFPSLLSSAAKGRAQGGGERQRVDMEQAMLLDDDQGTRGTSSSSSVPGRDGDEVASRGVTSSSSGIPKTQKYLLPSRASTPVGNDSGEGGASQGGRKPNASPFSHGDVVFWQWMAVQPPLPSPSRVSDAQPPVGKLQIPGALHSIDSSSLAFDTLAPAAQSQAPRTAVSTVQANNSTMLVLMVFLSVLCLGVGCRVHTNQSQQSTHVRRKPKRSPRRSLWEHSLDLVTVAKSCIGKLMSIARSPSTAVTKALQFTVTLNSSSTKHSGLSTWQLVAIGICRELWKKVVRVSGRLWKCCADGQLLNWAGYVNGRSCNHENLSSTGTPAVPAVSSNYKEGKRKTLRSAKPASSHHAVLERKGGSLVGGHNRSRVVGTSGSSVTHTTISEESTAEVVAGGSEQSESSVATFSVLAHRAEAIHITPAEACFPTSNAQPSHKVETATDNLTSCVGAGEFEPEIGDASIYGDNAVSTVLSSASASTCWADSVARGPLDDVRHGVTTNEPSSPSSCASHNVEVYPAECMESSDVARTCDRGGGHLGIRDDKVSPLQTMCDDDAVMTAHALHSYSLSSDMDEAEMERARSEVGCGGQQSSVEAKEEEFMEASLDSSDDADRCLRRLSDIGDVCEGVGSVAPLSSSLDTVPDLRCGGGLLKSSFWYAAHSDMSDEEIDGSVKSSDGQPCFHNNMLENRADIDPPPGFALSNDAGPSSHFSNPESSLYLDSFLTSVADLSVPLSLQSGHLSADMSLFGADSSELPPYWAQEAIYSSESQAPRPYVPPTVSRSNYSCHSSGLTLSSLLPLEAPLSSNNITISFTVRCRFLPPARVASIRIASALFGHWHTTRAMSMRCSLANPELWGLTVEIPRNNQYFTFKYIAIDLTGAMWVEPGSPRLLDLVEELQFGGDNIEREDSFEHGLQCLRDSYLFSS